MTETLTTEQALRAARIKHNVQQKDIAQCMGVSPTFVHDIEVGRRRLKEKYVAVLPSPVRKAVIKHMIREHKEAISRLQALRRAEP